MSVEECYRKSEIEKRLAQELMQKQAMASGLLFSEDPVEIRLNQGRVYVDAFGQTTSKLFLTDKRARKYFKKLVKKYGLDVQSSCQKVRKNGD